MSNLTLRILSALVLAPVVLLCLYAGGFYTQALLTLVTAAGMWEWSSMFLPNEKGTRIFVVALSAACGFCLMGTSSYLIGDLRALPSIFQSQPEFQITSLGHALCARR